MELALLEGPVLALTPLVVWTRNQNDPCLTSGLSTSTAKLGCRGIQPCPPQSRAKSCVILTPVDCSSVSSHGSTATHAPQEMTGCFMCCAKEFLSAPFFSALFAVSFCRICRPSYFLGVRNTASKMELPIDDATSAESLLESGPFICCPPGELAEDPSIDDDGDNSSLPSLCPGEIGGLQETITPFLGRIRSHTGDAFVLCWAEEAAGTATELPNSSYARVASPSLTPATPPL
mmetsp:Transcript_30697/g.44842  ORF Transcript_30697/g.44842 Transcript_30697/m.44842 type:complete len:233 (-) Transcript_30697:779-1477(-)